MQPRAPMLVCVRGLKSMLGRAQAYAIFDTAIGRCGIAWSEQGILGVQLAQAREIETRKRLFLLYPEAREARPTPNVAAAIEGIVALLRGATGDFTGALNLTSPPVTTVPPLPSTSIGSDLTVVVEAVLNALAGTLDVGIDYPLPTANKMPSQETTPARPPVP